MAYLDVITRAGDTWDIIALDLYNDEYRAPLLMEQNPTLTGYVVFPAGLHLVAPIIAAEDAKNSALPPWKRG